MPEYTDAVEVEIRPLLRELMQSAHVIPEPDDIIGRAVRHLVEGTRSIGSAEGVERHDDEPQFGDGLWIPVVEKVERVILFGAHAHRRMRGLAPAVDVLDHRVAARRSKSRG